MKHSSIAGGIEDVLQQGLVLLSEVPDGMYGLMVEEPFAASIGQHYRHVIDHFVCLVAGMESGRVDYDQRSRSRELETDIEYARSMTAMLLHLFQRLSPETLVRECQVLYSVGYRDQRAEELPSTIGRELAFCVGHAIHHYAIVRLLCAQLEVEVPVEFGIAPSTLKYRAAQALS